MFSDFTFYHNVKVEFGVGKVGSIADVVIENSATKVMIVTDKVLRGLGMIHGVCASLEAKTIPYLVYDNVQPNPRMSSVDECADIIKKEGCDFVIAVGGGSAMDVGKGAALMAVNEGKIWDYMYLRKDDVKAVQNAPLPVAAVPTTSGTGSEVSECIVVMDDKTEIKDVMYDSILLPKYAYLDPELVYQMPRFVTSTTGLDVLGHAIEAYISTLENVVADLFSKEAIKLTFQYLPASVNGDKEARGYMLLASMYAGIAQSKNGCIIPHAVSCPLSSLHRIPHGLGVGVTQVANLEFNKKLCLTKYKEIADYIDPECAKLSEEEALIALENKIHKLFEDIGMEEKLDIGPVDDAYISELSRLALLEMDIEVNPVQPVTQQDIEGIFRQIIKV